MSFSFLTSCFSFWDLKLHFLNSSVNAGFAASPPRNEVFFPAVATMHPRPVLIDFGDLGWDSESTEAQTERHEGQLDFFCSSLLWCSKARRCWFPPKALSCKLISLPCVQASHLGQWVFPWAGLGQEPFQKITKGKQSWGCFPAQDFNSVSPLLNKTELWEILQLLVLETASAFMGGKFDVFFRHGLWYCLRVGRVNKISDSANVLKRKVF